jgi:hypothetical protein
LFLFTCLRTRIFIRRVNRIEKVFIFGTLTIDKAMRYTAAEKEKMFSRVLKGLRSGVSLRVVLKGDGMPSRTSLYGWIEKDKSMSERFAQAQLLGDEVLFEKTLEDARKPLFEEVTETGTVGDNIIDKTTRRDNVARSRLIVQTTLDILARRNPRKYAPRVDVTSNNEALAAVPVITGMVIKNETEEPIEDADLF